MRRKHSRRFHFEQLEGRYMMAALIGDYDLNGVVAQNDHDVWKANYGQIGESPVDGNGDGIVDAADYTVWRDNFGRTLADLPPIAPQLVSAAATGATSIGVGWQASSGATSYSVQRRQPDTETDFMTIASGLTSTTYTDNMVVSNALYEYRIVAQNGHGSSPASQTAQATANQSNLTAYRPQDLQDANNPLPGPLYNQPFPKTPVRDQHESSSTLGPGIRIDGDADPVIFGVSTENDLIEVKVDRLPGQGNLILQTGGSLVLYYDYAKETPVPVSDATHTMPLSFVNNTVTVFVDWPDFAHGTDTLSLVDATTSAVQDNVRFHTFKSLAVVFGGRNQDPRDTDGDGSIGDPVPPIAGNREGIFDLAQNLYVTGWNVLAFASTDENIDNVITPAYDEIVNEVTNQLVGDYFDYPAGVAIMGYSWGGGAAHDLIERLWNDFEYIPLYGVFLDAVVHGSFVAQTDWSNETFYLLNIYQDNPENKILGGGTINPDDVPSGSILDEVNTTTAPGFSHNLTHFSIDDDPQIQAGIQGQLGALMDS